jgi:hypothetical protein
VRWGEARCAPPPARASVLIILENVEARCDEERLPVPADPGFTPTGEMKSVITVVAKTHHYRSAHVAGDVGDV